MGKVAIISKNIELVRFIELELSRWGVAFDVLDRLSLVSDEYDFCVVDTDTAGKEAIPLTQIETLFVSAPVSLLEISRVCMQKASAARVLGDTDTCNSDTVYVEDESSGIVRLCNMQIKLTGAEFDLLVALCEAKGRPVSREALMKLFGAQRGNIADVYVCSLRKKLETATSKKVIITERALGYRTVLKLVK